VTEELEVPAGSEEESSSTVAPSTIDPRAAIEITAQQFGVTPDYLEGALRLQDENRRVSEEVKRRQRDLELREARLEALSHERQRFQDPTSTYPEVDPALKPLADDVRSLKQMILEERKMRLDAEDQNRRIQEQGESLRMAYSSMMRSVPTQSRIEPEPFFQTMAEVYPGGLPEGVSPDRAVQVVLKYLGISAALSPGGPAYPTSNPLRNPRAQIFIPGGPTSSPSPLSPALDAGPQRPGETAEQYTERLIRVLKEAGVTSYSKSIPEGVKISA